MAALRVLVKEELAPYEPMGFLEGFDDDVPEDCTLMIVVSHVANAREIKASGPMRDKVLKLIEQAGTDREHTYLTSLFKHTAYDIKHKDAKAHTAIIGISKATMLEEVETVDPKVVLLCGDNAVKAVFGEVHASSVQGNFMTLHTKTGYRCFVACQSLSHEERRIKNAFDRAGAVIKSGGEL
jgi:hypothetical protein